MSDEEIFKLIKEIASILNVSREAARARFKNNYKWKYEELEKIREHYPNAEELIKNISVSYQKYSKVRNEEYAIVIRMARATYRGTQTIWKKLRNKPNGRGYAYHFTDTDMWLLKQNMIPDDYKEAMRLIEKYAQDFDNCKRKAHLQRV